MGVDLSDKNIPTLRTQAKLGLLAPTELSIETVFGCNAKCTMCFIELDTTRKKRVMKMDLYRHIIDEMQPYKDNLEKFDLWCLGEPTIDNWLLERVYYAKQRGFPHMAIATNAHALDPEMQDGLLEAGLDTVLISIDGATKETHEKIRIGLDFDRIIANVERMIQRRDASDYKTRFIVRFVNQDVNAHEYQAFSEYWSRRLSPQRRDDLYRYNEHNWGGYMGDKAKMLGNRFSEFIERKPCHYVFESLCILADGTLAPCPADFLEGQFGLGRVPEQSPIEAFNSAVYRKLRALHLDGDKNDIDLCKSCTILYSNAERAWTWHETDDQGATDRSNIETYMKADASGYTAQDKAREPAE